jgi:hypothetical protein
MPAGGGTAEAIGGTLATGCMRAVEPEPLQPSSKPQIA